MLILKNNKTGETHALPNINIFFFLFLNFVVVQLQLSAFTTPIAHNPANQINFLNL